MTRTQEELKAAKTKGDKKIQVCQWCNLHFPTTLSYYKHNCDQEEKKGEETTKVKLESKEREEKTQETKTTNNPYHICIERNFETDISKVRFDNEQEDLKLKYKTRKKELPDDQIKPIRKCKICKEYYKLKMQHILKVRFDLEDSKVRYCKDCFVYYVLLSRMHICHHIIPEGYETEMFVIKQGLPSCLKNERISSGLKGNAVLDIINKWVISTQQSKILATRLMNMYLLEICESWDSKSVTNFLLDENTILTAMSLCSKRELINNKVKDELINPRLFSLFNTHFSKTFELPCSDNLSGIHQAISHQLITNFDTYIETNFYKRHLQWIDLLLREMLTVHGPLVENDSLKHVKKLSKRLNFRLKSLIQDYSYTEEDQKEELDNIRVEIDAFFDQKVKKYLRLRTDSDKHLYSKKLVKDVMPYSKQIIQNMLDKIDQMFRPCVTLKSLQDSNDKNYKSSSTSNRYLLPWMYFISTDLNLEKKEYNLFPLADFVPGHINLDRTMWVILYKQLNDLKYLDEDTKNSIDWKSYFFNRDSNFWTKSNSKQSRTLRYISTDGVAASFVFERAILKNLSSNKKKKKKKKKAEQKQEKVILPLLTHEQLKGKTKIIALDEGRRHFFDAVIRSIPNRDHHEEEKHDFDYNKMKDRDKSITLRSSEWREMKGTNNIRYLQKNLLNLNEPVKIAQGLVISGKTCNREKFLLHLSTLQIHMFVLSTYYSKRIFRRHRLTAYSKTRQAWDKSIFEKLGLFTEQDYKSTIIVVGDASFAHNSPGHASLPTKSLYKNLAKKVDVYYQDEFRTSKLCSCCQSTVVPVIHKKSCEQIQREQVKLDKKLCDIQKYQPHYIIDPKRNIISPTRKPFGLRRCPQSGCRTLWNRDVNAAINIMNLFIYERIGSHCVPNYLKKKDCWRSYYQRNLDQTKIDVESDVDSDEELEV